jgi:hypothetical protein
MTKLSGFFDPRGARATQGIPPRLQYFDASGSYTFVIGERDAATGKYVAKHTPVPLGAKVVLDFGTIERGWLCFRPFDDQHLVPFPQPVPAQPEGEYTRAIRLPVLIEGFGLAQWTAAGIIGQNALFAVYVTFERAVEATQNKIPIVALRPSRQISIASRNGEVHTAPTLEIIGWTDRRTDQFGLRTVPAPIPIIARDGPPPQVEHISDGTADLSAASAANDNATGMPPAMSTATTPMPAANDNDDVFTTMTPIARSGPAAAVHASPPLF